jgi:hypothetical protein
VKLKTTYLGRDEPFEGDRTLWLRALPAGAKVTRATITLKDDAPFQETFTFVTPADSGELPAKDWGITKTSPGSFIEVDFHARRTLVGVTGSGGSSTLQVDLGGVYVGIANDGTMAPNRGQFSVPLPKGMNGALTPLPGLTVNKFKLTRDDTLKVLDITKVAIQSVPTNISVGMGRMPPFWTRPGELAIAATSPDFSLMLNAFLANAQPQNGVYEIPFVIHSDTIARLDVTLAIDYLIEKPILPPQLSEVTPDYSFSTLPSIDEALTTVKLPRGAKPVRANAQIQGEFQPTRIALDRSGEESEKLISVKVSPEYSLAQLLQSDTEIEVTGIDLPLANTQPGLAGLNLSIQEDADGKPSGEVLISAEVSVEKPLPGQSSWGSVTLPTPFRILPREKKHYWLILQSQIGQAYWRTVEVPLDKPEPALQCSRDRGLSWRIASVTGAQTSLMGLFRLRHTPERFSIPVQLQIGKGPGAVRRRLDEFAPLGRIEFNFDFAEKLGEYLSKPANASPCGMGEFLTNGSFDLPIPDDATRRLFGFDAGNEQELNGKADLSRGVNLSMERFIHLSVVANNQSVEENPQVRIDCAGVNPARTTGPEIAAAINLAMRQKIAKYDKNKIILSPSTEAETVIILHPWIEIAVPQGWQQPPESGGEVSRFKLPIICYSSKQMEILETLPPQRIIAVLNGGKTDPAILAQQMSVVSRCTYRLQFLYFASQSKLDPPRWQVRWFNASHQVIQEEGGVLVSPQDRAISSSVPSLQIFSKIDVSLQAPEGSAHAEVRFVQPPKGKLFVDDVSFSPTLETLSNGNFNLWETPATPGAEETPFPFKWAVISGWIDPYLKDVIPRGALLRGQGPEDAVLAQKVTVQPGAEYKLSVQARLLGMPVSQIEAQPTEKYARVEINWLDSESLNTPTILLLDGRDFSERTLTGTVPAQVSSAEIRLIQPQSLSDLLVKSVSFSQIDFVSVPLIFLAESPGQLTLSHLHVLFALPEIGG